MAAFLGDRAPFQLRRPWLRWNQQDNGTLWVSVFFEAITRGGMTWSWPDLDAHVTLIYIKLPEESSGNLMLRDARLGQVREQLAKIHERGWLAAGNFNETFATPNYAWVDLLVAMPAHSTLHSLAAIMHAGRLAWGAKASFHLSFRSPAP